MKKICLSICICCLAFINAKGQAPCGIALTSAVGTDTQSVSVNHPITNIIYSFTDVQTIANVTGLPAGTTIVYTMGAGTIAGTPTVAGIYTYTVTSTGTCTDTETGTITVN